MKIGLTYDLKSDWEFRPGDAPDANAEMDKPETIEAIIGALEWGGHQVQRIGNVKSLLAQIDELDLDIVFNICEGARGRNRESEVPVILEMKGIPFVGSDGLTEGLALDKSTAKKCFIADNIPTPRFFTATDSKNLEKLSRIGFPLMVKACYEGTSKGITKDSRVEDLAALKRQVEFITKTYRQPALVEEFIRGTEFTVAVLGNNPCEAMPVVQVSVDGKVNLGDEFYSYERVFTDNLRYVCPAKISETLERKLQRIAERAYDSVGCRDFGRVDFRVDEKGNPYVLEINPLPSLEKKDVFAFFPKVLGTTYDAVINRIVDCALKRYKLIKNKKEMQAILR
jgi:D-alanine-D-alanine ligase